MGIVKLKRNRNLWLTALLIVLLIPSAHAEDDFQYWSRYSLQLVDTKYVDFYHYWEFRVFDDASDVGLWYTSQKLNVHPWKYLTLGLNYTYLENEVVKTGGNEEFKYQHRLELEVSPHWNWKDRLKFKNRNRVEFRWIEDNGSDNGRYRQLWGVEVPLKKIPHVKSVYTNTELFFDFNKEEFNQNRLVPFGVTIELPWKSSLQIFYMIQSVKKQDWSSNQILGTQINVKF